jgi:hypothetical protein
MRIRGLFRENKMKVFRTSFLTLAAAAVAFGQQWEVGASAGIGYLPGKSVTSSSGSATTGLQTGVAFGAYIGQTISPHLGGEVHYAFRHSNLKLQSGGTTTTFSGQSHMLHYDVILHTARNENKAQLFAAFGGGMRFFRGTGKEAAYQPLSQFAYFTKTQTVKPMASIGGGIKIALRPRMYLRAEVRDYITPFPKELITPAPGSKVGGLLHDIVPMVGISYEY